MSTVTKVYNNLLWSLVTGQPLEEGGTPVTLDSWNGEEKDYSYLHVLKQVYDEADKNDKTKDIIKNLASKGVVANDVTEFQARPEEAKARSWLLLIPPIISAYWQTFVDISLNSSPDTKKVVYISPLVPADKIASKDTNFQIVKIYGGKNQKSPMENKQNAEFFKVIINKPNSGYYYVTVAAQTTEGDASNAKNESVIYDIVKKISDGLKRPDASQLVNPSVVQDAAKKKTENLVLPFGSFKALYAKRVVVGSVPFKLHTDPSTKPFDPKMVDIKEIKENLKCLDGDCKFPEGKAIGFIDLGTDKRQRETVDCNQSYEGMKTMAEKHGVDVTPGMTKDDICAAVRRSLISKRRNFQHSN